MKIELSTDDIGLAVKSWVQEKYKMQVEGPVHFHIACPGDKYQLTAKVEISEEK